MLAGKIENSTYFSTNPFFVVVASSLNLSCTNVLLICTSCMLHSSCWRRHNSFWKKYIYFNFHLIWKKQTLSFVYLKLKFSNQLECRMFSSLFESWWNKQRHLFAWCQFLVRSVFLFVLRFGMAKIDWNWQQKIAINSY